MTVRYITIEREYGSGGTKIAALTAEKCGVSCYGREILEKAAEKLYLPVSVLNEYEESVSGSFIYSMFVMSQSQTADPDLLSPEAKLFVHEMKIIREFAAGGPAVFVGHCASQALKDKEGVVRVFIHADEESKHDRIMRDYHIPEREVNAVSRKFNRKRANYYAFCTQKKWSDPDNYDMVLDSSRLGIEGCAEVLAALMRR